MQFDTNGHLLPYEPIPVDQETFERVFVEAFPTSATRRPLFVNYIAYINVLRQWMPGGFVQWIDGSFVTRKLNPRDIDVVTFINADVLVAYASQLEAVKKQFYQQDFRIDSYFVTVYPQGHRLEVLTTHDRAEWLFNFTKTAPKSPLLRRYKGFLEISY